MRLESGLPEQWRVGGRNRIRLLYVLGSLGLLLRVVLWRLSEGSNDIRTFAHFAQFVDAYGLGGTYVRDPWFNHPPLMGVLARATWRLAPRIGLPFAQTFKLFGMFAELATALLLAQIWQRRVQPERAAEAFAAYGCALCCILISGFHGNTDPAYWFLVLAAVYLLQDRDAPLLAGLALGAALNVKLIPLLVVLPLAACCKNARAVARYALGGVIAFVPFASIVAGFDSHERAAFVRNVFGYTSLREYWGIELIERVILAAFQASAPKIALAVNEFGFAYAQHGSKILLATTTALALWQVFNRRSGLDAYAMAALCFCLFLVLASGFGVQYLGAVVPLLLACRIREGFAVATLSGVFIGLIYASFVRTWTPIYSQHGAISPVFGAPSLATWWLLVLCCRSIWRSRATNRAPSDIEPT